MSTVGIERYDGKFDMHEPNIFAYPNHFALFISQKFIIEPITACDSNSDKQESYINCYLKHITNFGFNSNNIIPALLALAADVQTAVPFFNIPFIDMSFLDVTVIRPVITCSNSASYVEYAKCHASWALAFTGIVFIQEDGQLDWGAIFS